MSEGFTASEITVGDLDKICTALFEKRKQIDDIKSELSAKQKELDEIETTVMALLEHHNKQRYSLGGLGTISVQDKLSYKIPRTDENREQFFNYLKEKDLFNTMISVNSQTLNAFCKAELESAASKGLTEFNIPGIEEPTLYKQIQIRKEK